MATLQNILPLAAEEEGGGSFLVSPGLGLMIWTLIAFLATFFILKRLAYPRIQEALEKRASAVSESIDAAKRTRDEADQLLQEYRERLREAREQADDDDRHVCLQGRGSPACAFTSSPPSRSPGRRRSA